ncbi:MAG: CocE/NonD family hydrolase [Polyangiaceae bacterium]|nr:CocE/NonD family hydrolase [Polyangiaceae bacterium]
MITALKNLVGRRETAERPSAADAHWDPRWHGHRLARDPGNRRSLYLPMRDGPRVAIDVTLPTTYRDGVRLPTILRQTRYFRSVEMPPMLDFRLSRDAFDIVAATRERFLAKGYAWVDVDVRGSGVSSGSWPGPWSEGEVRDGAEIVDFIIRQPWSNGLVGSTGISYEGTTCEMLLANRHEAVRAVAPRFSLFCAYEDVAFPGGVHLAWFTERWARYNRLLDDHRVHDAMAELVYVIARARSVEPAIWSGPVRTLLERLGPERATRAIGLVFGVFLRGGRRVDDDPDGSLRAAALLDHVANGDVHQLCLQGCYKDDVAPGHEDVAFAGVSPRGNLQAIAASGAAVFSYGGWLDGGYAQAATRRFASLAASRPESTRSRSRLLLGPWGHAGFFSHDPANRTTPATFPHEVELFEFFDRELRGEASTENPVRYFTLVENAWKSAPTWPPPNVRDERMYLDVSGTLTSSRPRSEGRVEVHDDRSFGTGERSRWRGLLAGFVPADYPDFGERIKGQVTFASAPFDGGCVVTGHPIVRVFARAQSDFGLMAYLADVSPDNRWTYVSEGQLRALHRAETTPERGYVPLTPYHSFDAGDGKPIVPGETMELSFGLLPTSYWFRPGHRAALVLTLGDCDHFSAIEGSRGIELLLGESSLDLPIER